MIVSRIIARRRIADGTVPSFLGAWGLVVLDAVLVGCAVVLGWSWVSAWMQAQDPSIWLVIGIIVVFFFIPGQILLILSALWAAKSRWAEQDTKD